MVGPVLKEAVIAIFFCNIFVNCQDILELFYPKPGFPQELNEWLSNVQKHKRDFRLIRDIARKHEMDVDEGLIDNKGLGLNSKEKYDNYGSLSDDRPTNDIYPHVYKTKNNHILDFGTSLYKPQKDRLVSKNIRSPIRLRRNLEDNFYDRRDKVEVQPTGKIGEVKRSDNKYPQRYVNNIKNSKEHLKKRDIQIDVLNEGKLVKQIKEQGRDSKSIVLNIQSLDEPKDPLNLNKPDALLNAYVPVSLDGNQIGIGDNKIKDFDSSINTETKIQGFDSPVNSDNKINAFDSNLITDNKIKLFDPAIKMLNAPERSIDLDNSQTKAQEFVNNYKNLYGANLNLNTDSSIARDDFDKTALLYHVTITDLGTVHNSYENEHTPSTENINIPKDLTNTNIEKNNIDRANFNRNDLRDMSQFWTKSEKNQMQKGINFAQNKWNMKNVPQLPNPVQPAQNNDGFEQVKSVVVEENGSINDNNDRQNAHDAADSHYVNMPPNSKLHNKRQLASLEDTVHAVDNNDLLSLNNETISDSIPANNFNALVPSSNPSDNMGITNIDEMRELAPSTDGIFLTDSLSGNTNMNSEMELADLDNLPVHTYLPSSLDLELQPFGESTETVGVLYEKNNKVPVFKEIQTVDKHIHDYKVITDQASADETLEDSGNDTADNAEEDTAESFDENKETESPVNINANDDDSRPIEPNDRIEEVHRHVEDVLTKTEHHRLNKHAEPNRFQNMLRKGFKIITKPFKTIFQKNKPKYSPVHKKINILGNKSPNGFRCKEGHSKMEYNQERNRFSERFSNKDPSSFEERNSNEMEAQSHHEKLPKRKRSKHKRKKKKHQRKYRRDQYRQRWKKSHNSRDNDPIINPPVKETDTIPAFNGRQLKMADYVYDAYLYGPSEEDEDSDEEVTSRRNARVEEAVRSPVEGDYNDEEDSVTVKHKKGDFNIVKKTDNVFANPITTTEQEEVDEYYDDDYGVSGNLSNQDNKDNKKHDKHKADVHSKEEEVANFGRHLHKKLKSPKTVTSKDKKAPINGNRYSDISHELNSLKKMREPRHLPSKNFLEKSEYQQWPKFVISDQEKEENLRKRSLATRKKQAIKNNFPLASKDFFIKSDIGPKAKEAGIVNRAVPSNCGVKTCATTEKLCSTEVKNCETTTTMSLDQIENSVSNMISNKNCSCSDIRAEADACDLENPKIVHNICEENENFNRTRSGMTTVLSIMHECQGVQVSSNDSQTYEKLDELLNGNLPLKVLADIFSHVESCDHLKRRFNKGLKRTQHKPGSFQDLTDTSNEESKKLVNLMSNIMKRLQFTTTCQTLPKTLRPYLKSLTKNRKGDALSRTREMEEIELDDNQNTNNFIFQSSNRGDNLEEKVSVLKDLLVKFNNLPEKCKGRAEPVKEYIENHLGMLNNMLSGDSVNAPNERKIVDNRSDSHKNKEENQEKIENDLVQEQLNSLGLGSKHNFQPKFDLDELIQTRVHHKQPNPLPNTDDHLPKRAKINSKRDLRNHSGTQKYNRLVDAIRKVSAKVNRETKLGEIYGRLTEDDFNGYTDPKSKRDTRDTKASFESPLVYSF